MFDLGVVKRTVYEFYDLVPDGKFDIKRFKTTNPIILDIYVFMQKMLKMLKFVYKKCNNDQKCLMKKMTLLHFAKKFVHCARGIMIVL